MKRRHRLAIAGLIVALAAACGGGGGTDRGAAGPPAAAPGAWVVLGSSTSAGVGAPAGAGWVDRLAAEVQGAGVQVANLARAGMLTTQALPVGTPLPDGLAAPVPGANIDAALARGPVLVLLSFPSNDAAAGVPAADTVARWQALAARAAAQGSATLVVGTQPRAAFSEAQKRIVAQTEELSRAAFGACHVAVFDALAAPDGTLAPELRADDGDHPNAAGHALILERVRAALASGACVVVAR